MTIQSLWFTKFFRKKSGRQQPRPVSGDTPTSPEPGTENQSLDHVQIGAVLRLIRTQKVISAPRLAAKVRVSSQDLHLLLKDFKREGLVSLKCDHRNIVFVTAT